MSTEVKEMVVEAFARISIYNKEVLSLEEAARYCGMSKTGMYQMVRNNNVPVYRPTERTMFFKRKELEAWLCSNQSERLRLEANRVLSTPAKKGRPRLT